MPNITVVIPTYNEINNLSNITSALFALNIPDLKILVVDDASPDKTGELADQLAAKYPERLHVIHQAGKLGLGNAYVQGFTWALEHQADFVIQMDADFSHSPKYIHDCGAYWLPGKSRPTIVMYATALSKRPRSV